MDRIDEGRDTPGTGGLAYRGVAYDTGTNFATGQGALSRVVWSTWRMREEIAAIRDDLHCNSVTLYGSDLDRLAETATVATGHGLHVWLQPRLVDRPQAEILNHLVEAARLAEALRRHGAEISLSVGCVHQVFTPGIVEGTRYHERMANVFAGLEHNVLTPTATVDLDAAAGRLNAFLDRASALARENFGGQISYAAAPFEDVDWRLFDAIALMYYYAPNYRSRQDHVDEIARYARWDKPILIAEFGTATYAGAEQKAFLSFDIVERKTPIHTVFPEYVRDEQAQAEYHVRMLALFEQLGVRGVAVSEFIHPTHPHSSDPSLDLDTASMAIVKTIRDDYSDPASGYRFEPKASFRAIAEYYARAGSRADTTV